MSSSTFSRQTKQEIALIEIQAVAEREMMLLFLCMGNAVFRGRQFVFQTQFEPVADLLAKLLYQVLGIRADRITLRGLNRIVLTERESYERLVEWLEKTGSFNTVKGQTLLDPVELASPLRRVALRALFLSFGSLTDPRKAYHLELGFRRRSVAGLAEELLELEGIEGQAFRRSGGYRIYLKEAEAVSTFLGIIGAHSALLHLEALRVEKGLRNSVNRVVNCDQANLRRSADSAVRHVQAARYLEAQGILSCLSLELQEAARLRMENPELCLKELGELCNPPLAKSGINHRLRKLQELAQTHQERQAKEKGMTREQAFPYLAPQPAYRPLAPNTARAKAIAKERKRQARADRRMIGAYRAFVRGTHSFKQIGERGSSEELQEQIEEQHPQDHGQGREE